ncbi:MAG: hypothetical protein DDT19_00020 [Syntrophomonadaceae bacterium]|nr:hypothetical protein [Bacillota bacterium]
MKPIIDLLKEIQGLIDKFAKKAKKKGSDVSVVLIGGRAVIAHGVDRTTKDVDVMAYGVPYNKFGRKFFKFLEQEFKERGSESINITYMPPSNNLSDPFQHELIIIKDAQNIMPKIDILIARYKWELEGMQSAKKENKVPMSIMPRPYLIAMKLMASGPRDFYDIRCLYDLLTAEEKIKTVRLAKLIKKDRNLDRILDFTGKGRIGEGGVEESQLISPKSVIHSTIRFGN